MKNCKLLVLLLSVCIACHATLQSGNAHFIVKNLKTEYAVTPLGLDVELPRFSWQMESLGAERVCSRQPIKLSFQMKKETLCGIVEKHKMDSL